MSVYSEIQQLASKARSEIKKVPFRYFARAYNGIIKEIDLKRANFNTSQSLFRLQAFWADRVKDLKKHPEPTPEKQAEQDNDCHRLIEYNYRVLMEVIQPIREKHYAEIKTDSLKDMAKLMEEFALRYGQ